MKVWTSGRFRRATHPGAVNADSVAKVELNAAVETVSAERRKEANLPARNAKSSGSEVGRRWIL